jgi:PIN domain nuclease of toxin-antitoxin system
MSDSYLLDTDVWLGLMNGDEAMFSKSALKTLSNAAMKNQLVVSDASVWEAGRRSASGALTLWPTLDDWLKRASVAPGISYLPIDRETLVLSTRVPGVFAGDDTDRILLAAAALSGIGLATNDERMLEYGKRFGRIPMLNTGNTRESA